MNKPLACLREKEIDELVVGGSDASDAERMFEHVQHCPQCESRFEQRAADTPLVQLVRRSGVAARSEVDETSVSACQEALQRVLERGRNSRAAARGGPVDAGTLWAAAGGREALGAHRLIRPIAAGGMGVVFLAEHTHLGREEAVKVLPIGFNHDGMQRFFREMRVLADLSHENIVAALDAGIDEGVPYLVMEYVDGTTVEAALQGRGQPVPIPEACEIARQAALGLDAVHGAGLVHRDIKPSNLMITPQGRVKILDFGLARLYENPDSELTTSARRMGTPQYVAPEQCRDARTADSRSDLFSLGATLYRLVYGQPPTTRGSRSASGASAAAPPDVPAPVSRLLKQLLSERPDRRPASARSVAATLAPFAEGADLTQLLNWRPAASEVPTVQDSTETTAVAPQRRYPWITSAAVVLLIVLTTTLFALTRQSLGSAALSMFGWSREPAHDEVQPPSPEEDPAAANDAKLAEQGRADRRSTFRGRTLSQWQEVLQRERDPAVIADAIRGVDGLAENPEVRRTITQQAFDASVGHLTRMSRPQLAEVPFPELRKLMYQPEDPNPAYGVVRDALRDGDSVERRLAAWIVQGWYEPKMNYGRFVEADSEHERGSELFTLLSRRPTEGLDERLAAFLQVAVALDRSPFVAPGVEAALQQLAADPQWDPITRQATRLQDLTWQSLIRWQSDCPELLDGLLMVLAQPERTPFPDRLRAAKRIGQLKGQAPRAAERISEAIGERIHQQPLSDRDYWDSTALATLNHFPESWQRAVLLREMVNSYGKLHPEGEPLPPVFDAMAASLDDPDHLPDLREAVARLRESQSSD